MEMGYPPPEQTHLWKHNPRRTTYASGKYSFYVRKQTRVCVSKIFSKSKINYFYSYNLTNAARNLSIIHHADQSQNILNTFFVSRQRCCICKIGLAVITFSLIPADMQAPNPWVNLCWRIACQNWASFDDTVQIYPPFSAFTKDLKGFNLRMLMPLPTAQGVALNAKLTLNTSHSRSNCKGRCCLCKKTLLFGWFDSFPALDFQFS